MLLRTPPHFVSYSFLRLRQTFLFFAFCSYTKIVHICTPLSSFHLYLAQAIQKLDSALHQMRLYSCILQTNCGIHVYWIEIL